MGQLIAHLVGDYVLQNHLMATRKTSSWLWAAVHALFYGLPFLLLVSAPWQWVVIVGTHAVIDRYRVAAWWVRFWGIGCAGWLPIYLHRWLHREAEDLVVDPAPPFLAVWLLIIADNTLHLLINYLTLAAA